MDGPVRNRGELPTGARSVAPQPETVGYYVNTIEKMISEIEMRLCGAEEQLRGPVPENTRSKEDIATPGLCGLAERTARRAISLPERLNAILTQIGI